MQNILVNKKTRALIKSMLPESLLNQLRLCKLRKKYQHFVGKTIEEVFTQIYETNQWGNLESRSGSGSTEIETRAIRAALPKLIKEFNISVLLDVPCGDFSWMQSVDLGNCSYIGGDIVKELIIINQNKYGTSLRKFIHCDLTKDKLPYADLILCRDCFFHLSFSDIFKTLKNFKASRSKYLLVTTHPEAKENYPMITGGYRYINLCVKPFNFPPPLRLIQERRDLRFFDIDKSLGLWQIKDLIL